MPASNRKPASPSARIPIDLVDELTARTIAGGTKPISKPTWYRWIASGRMPRGVLIGPNCRRYSRQEIEAAIRALFAARDGATS